mgnify:CR=1 FL=1
MNNYIPESAGYLVSKAFDISNVRDIRKISNSISKEDPDAIAEFIIIFTGLFYSYSKTIEEKIGKEFNEKFIENLNKISIRELIEKVEEGEK